MSVIDGEQPHAQAGARARAPGTADPPLALALAFAAVLSCGPSALEPLELTANLTANPVTALVEDSVTVVLEAQGTNLLGVIVDYGDDSRAYERDLPSARTLGLTLKHAYDSAAVFTITARIDEATDTIVRTVSVTVNDPAGTAMPRASLLFPIRDDDERER
jgi:hypothetical protein